MQDYKTRHSGHQDRRAYYNVQYADVTEDEPSGSNEGIETVFFRAILKCYRTQHKCLLCGDPASEDGSKFMDHVRNHLDHPLQALYPTAGQPLQDHSSDTVTTTTPVVTRNPSSKAFPYPAPSREDNAKASSPDASQYGFVHPENLHRLRGQ